VRLMKDSATHPEEFLQSCSLDELLSRNAHPVTESRVDFQNGAIWRCDEHAAGRLVEEVVNRRYRPCHSSYGFANAPKFLDRVAACARRTQVRTVTSVCHDSQHAVRQSAVHVLADSHGRDQVVRRLDNERLSPKIYKVLRLSDMKVTLANCFAISGSVRQKLAVSSAPSSGCSGTPMIAGAMLLAQPR
jgi:hypothetical protein